MALLCGSVGRVTAQNGGFHPGQSGATTRLVLGLNMSSDCHANYGAPSQVFPRSKLFRGLSLRKHG
jgi:hypothetical protein